MDQLRLIQANAAGIPVTFAFAAGGTATVNAIPMPLALLPGEERYADNNVRVKAHSSQFPKRPQRGDTATIQLQQYSVFDTSQDVTGFWTIDLKAN